jgi:DNA-binding NtrC family response regulator
MIRDLAAKILTRDGYEIEVAGSGREGIDRFRVDADNIALVLLDLTLNDIDGIEALRQIRSVAPGVPCILSSGRSLHDGEVPKEIAARTAFLEKPYRSGQLSELVRKLLDI